MKKNHIYFYLDQPSGNEQLRKVIPKIKNLKNYKVKYISTERINFSKKDLFNYYKHSSKDDIPKDILRFKNLNHFEKYLKKISKNSLLFIRERSFNKNNNYNYDLNLFKKYRIKTIFFEYNNWIKCNFKKEFFFNMLRLFWFKFNSLSSNLNYYQPNYFIGSGNFGKERFKKKKWYRTKYLDCPSIWIDFKIKAKKKYIIYVDENILFSRDQFLFNKKYKKTSNPNKFLNDLLNFFSLIEKKFNQKIIICCSNRHKYEKNIFGKRKIVYGKTLDFISKSKLVLGHRSDALYQAIFSQTPVMLLKHKTFSFMRNIYIFSKSINHFNKKSEYIEDYLSGKSFLDLSIDREYYKKLLKNYFLSSGLKSTNFYEFFSYKLNKNLIK